MMVKSIDAIGRLEVEFSEDMVDEQSGFNLSDLNATSMEVKVTSV